MFQVEFIECVAAKPDFPQQSGMWGCCGHSGQGRAHSCGDRRCCFPCAGDRRESPALAAERHDDEVHGAEAGAGPEAHLPHRQAKARQVLKGHLAGRILDAPLLATHTRARLPTGTHAHAPIYATDGHLADTPAPLRGSSRPPCQRPGPGAAREEAGARLPRDLTPDWSHVRAVRRGGSLPAARPLRLRCPGMGLRLRAQSSSSRSRCGSCGPILACSSWRSLPVEGSGPGGTATEPRATTAPSPSSTPGGARTGPLPPELCCPPASLRPGMEAPYLFLTAGWHTALPQSVEGAGSVSGSASEAGWMLQDSTDPSLFFLEVFF